MPCREPLYPSNPRRTAGAPPGGLHDTCSGLSIPPVRAHDLEQFFFGCHIDAGNAVGAAIRCFQASVELGAEDVFVMPPTAVPAAGREVQQAQVATDGEPEPGQKSAEREIHVIKVKAGESRLVKLHFFDDGAPGAEKNTVHDLDPVDASLRHAPQDDLQPFFALVGNLPENV